MNDSCTCCSGCSSWQSATSYKNSFFKRLLVAVSVVIIIAMCLTPAEARSVEHRRRHQRRPDMAQLTKDETMKRPKNPSTEQFKNATRKIKHKLRNTKRFFDQDRKVLNETREYRDGMPSWLPAVNFVDIHFHDYRTSRKVGKSITERKFTYLMPKLYKTLKEYEVLFKLLLNVQLDLSDDPFTNYIVVRQKLLTDTLEKLYSTIAEIQENMIAVNMPIPPFDKNRMKLDALDKKVDATQCLKNDYIAFRGYGNLLNNWYSEFRCPMNKKSDRKCAVFHAKMNEKLGNKRFKNNRNI
ncbi:uncharacterized protein LOC125066891 isoform X1 [Vanessa atalanta]|uniref:uncharacterized protein LOC125066891 isoform X1 n=1 Tax=Vanessa atalanta TaxID=42275 RepID=UPI001FCD120E|nr:uncharacterized protein LOC125066891 isoform X1 [Vanessa atalanta]